MRLKFKFPLNMPDVKLKRNSIHLCPLVVGFPNPVRKNAGQTREGARVRPGRGREAPSWSVTGI